VSPRARADSVLSARRSHRPLLRESAESSTLGSLAPVGRKPGRNVTFTRGKKPKSNNTSFEAKIPLAQYRRGAKQVEKQLIQPLIEELLDQDIIPSRELDDYKEELSSKLYSFQQVREGRFQREFGEFYSEFRQDAWASAKKDHAKGKPLPREFYSRSLHLPDSMCLIGEMPLEGYSFNFRYDEVKLISPCWNEFQLSTFQKVLAVSGKLPFTVSPLGEELKYVCRARIPEGHMICNSELEELRRIYKLWWYSTNFCQTRWLNSIYADRGMGKNVLECNLKRYVSWDGMEHRDDEILFEADGIPFWTNVDTLYKWTEYTREVYGDKTDWQIGESPEEGITLVACYFESLGIQEWYIKETLTKELLMDELEKTPGVLREILNIPDIEEPRYKSVTSDGLPSEWKRAMAFDMSGFQNARFVDDEDLEWMLQFENYFEPEEFKEVRFEIDLTNIDLKDLAGNSEGSITDEEETSQVGSDEDIFSDVDEDLPYLSTLHKGVDEFENVGAFEGHAPSDSEEEPEDETERRPGKLDKLGNDLVDPAVGHETRTTRFSRQITFLYHSTYAGRIVNRSSKPERWMRVARHLPNG
jgi:hypothetical protein